jgi:hypothetical protein
LTTLPLFLLFPPPPKKRKSFKKIQRGMGEGPSGRNTLEARMGEKKVK